MYFYALSNGEYSDYSYTIIMHEKKFSITEFADMFNKALKSRNRDFHFHDDIAETMCEMFGFKVLKVEFEINKDYGEFREITKEDIHTDETFIALREFR